MELVNRTGFAAVLFRQFDRNGRLDAVIAVRGTFDIVGGRALQVAAVQEGVQWEDRFDGDPQAAPLLRQADLVPFKPGTDVTVLGDAHCPDPAGLPAWPCGIQMTGPSGAVLLDKRLRITGPRWWRPRPRRNWRALWNKSEPDVLVDWELSAPEPAHRLPLDWRLAWGGPIADEPGAVHAGNPIGIGIVGRSTGPEAPVAAAQIELAGAPITDWQSSPVPAGLGPISGVCIDRARHAGTYDQAWLDHRDPLCPTDFDERYWQCAPPDQVITPWLRGTEHYTLSNMHATIPELTGSLPGIMLGVLAERPRMSPERFSLQLDGVHFDLRNDAGVVVLTWRTRLPMPEALGARITLAERARVAEAA